MLVHYILFALIGCDFVLQGYLGQKTMFGSPLTSQVQARYPQDLVQCPSSNFCEVSCISLGVRFSLGVRLRLYGENVNFAYPSRTGGRCIPAQT